MSCHGIEGQGGMSAEDLARMNKVLRHRLGNFISGIKTSISLVQQEVKGVIEPELEEYFPLIIRECVLLEELNHRMTLLFDKVQPGGVTTVKQIVEKLLREAGARFPSVAVRVEISEAVAGMTVQGDEAVATALLEIMKNAMEAAGRSEVCVQAAVVGDRLQFRISDGGAGVAGGDLDKIFLSFYTTKSKHLGIGLPIARRLLAAAGGDVSVLPVDYKGFAIGVTIPVMQRAGDNGELIADNKV